MEIPDTTAAEEAGVWDWGNLLDFTVEEDDPLILPWDSEDSPIPTAAPVALPTAQEASPRPLNQTSTKTTGESNHVRKRDPRLLCENFLAGRIPCSCPEVDEMDEEEEEGGIGEVNGGVRKRAKTGGLIVVVRCQVPGCQADIRELKGYHRRHRVCLRCANAASVVLDGEPKRYCQQCGKFHILTDFDEGKRSCRRKLERHNKRRQRRCFDYRNVVEREKEVEDAPSDREQIKELSNGVSRGTNSLCTSNKMVDAEPLLGSEDGHGSPFCSVPSVHTVHSNSVASFQASGKIQKEERIDNSRSALFSSFCDKKNNYSTVCPTGRISFKLYDWNPAEFPRRLRHQIFQWLSSMPVELEGYIRPGCTILTVFIAMPQFMWEKLSEDAVFYVNDLVKAPESLLSGRGDMLMYLSNMIFQVRKDGTSMMNVKMEVQVPKLHYVYPNYFEAGKPMEFVACGSNLFWPKFRFLVSFAGKYLAYESCQAIPHGTIRSCHGIEADLFQNTEHQIFRIRIHCTESELFGPAFIEVENESGLSNFIPVLFGDKHILSELERMQEPYREPLCSDGIMSQITDASVISGLCEVYASKQKSMSELLLDIAWFVKKPLLDNDEVLLNSMHIQRANCLLIHLIQNESVSILGKVLNYLEIVMNGKDLKNAVNRAYDADILLLRKYMDNAREILHEGQSNGRSKIDSVNSTHKGVLLQQSDPHNDMPMPRSIINHDGEAGKKDGMELIKNPAYQDSVEDFPLMTEMIIQRTEYCPRLGSKWQQESWGRIFPRTITRTRLAILIMVGVVTCFGLCVTFIHPRRVWDFTVSVRRCVSGGSKP